MKLISFRLITVATSLCKLFELFCRDDLEKTYYAPPHKFRFRRGTVVANALIDAESAGECLALASHDAESAFDSLIRPAMLLKAAKRELSPTVILTLRDMNSRPRIRLKLPPDKNMPPVARTKLIPVLKGARQGAVSSSGLFNNYVIDAQGLCSSSLILSSRNMSLICYADDVLNLNRTLQQVSDVFSILEAE